MSIQAPAPATRATTTDNGAPGAATPAGTTPAALIPRRRNWPRIAAYGAAYGAAGLALRFQRDRWRQLVPGRAAARRRQ
jgi:hypothetical protein